MGEPYTFGFEPVELPRYLAARRLILIEDVGGSEYRERYLIPLGRRARAVGRIPASGAGGDREAISRNTHGVFTVSQVEGQRGGNHRDAICRSTITRTSLRRTNVSERVHQEFRRRVKTQGSLPTEDGALILLFGLVMSGQITFVQDRRRAEDRRQCFRQRLATGMRRWLCRAGRPPVEPENALYFTEESLCRTWLRQ